MSYDGPLRADQEPLRHGRIEVITLGLGLTSGAHGDWVYVGHIDTLRAGVILEDAGSGTGGIGLQCTISTDGKTPNATIGRWCMYFDDTATAETLASGVGEHLEADNAAWALAGHYQYIRVHTGGITAGSYNVYLFGPKRR